MFVAEMIIFVAFLVALCFASSYIQVVIFLFGLGLALGCDYPTAHMIISENIPSTARGKLVLGAFAFQAVGALAGIAVGFLVLSVLPELGAWRWMYASAIIPAVLVTLGRFYIVESANWLSSRGEIEKAEREAKRLLVRKPQYPTEIKLAAPEAKTEAAQDRRLRRAVQQRKPARDNPGVGSLVPAGSGNLWHRHLHPDHPRRGARRHFRPCPQHRRRDPARILSRRRARR